VEINYNLGCGSEIQSKWIFIAFNTHVEGKADVVYG